MNYFYKREIINKNNIDDDISRFFVIFENFFKIDITRVIVFFVFFIFFIVVIVLIVIVVVIVVVVVIIIVVLVVFVDSTFLLFLQFFIFINLSFEIIETLVCSISQFYATRKNALFDFFDRVKTRDNETRNERNSIVEKIIDDRIEKINTNDFVNVNNDKKFFVEIVYFDIIKRLIIHRSTIDKYFDVIKKIDEIFVNKSILIYFKFV